MSQCCAAWGRVAALWVLLSVARGGAWAESPGPAPGAEERLYRTHGWVIQFSSSVNGSLTHNHHVSGVDDGLAVTLGVVLDSLARLKLGQHVWESGCRFRTGWSKTATQKNLLKSSDWAEVTTRYVYALPFWDRALGLFAGLSLGASVFPGDIAFSEDTDLVYRYTDGSEASGVAEKQKRLRITGPFTPLVFRQLAGVVAKPYRGSAGRLDLRFAGVGQEVWATGFSLDDDRSTPEKELRQLRHYQQVGVRLEMALSGEVNKHVTYSLSADLLVPFFTSVPTPTSGFNLLDLDLRFALSLKLSRWASLEYLFGAKRMPMLVSAWQVSNQLVLSVTLAI